MSAARRDSAARQVRSAGQLEAGHEAGLQASRRRSPLPTGPGRGRGQLASGDCGRTPAGAARAARLEVERPPTWAPRAPAPRAARGPRGPGCRSTARRGLRSARASARRGPAWRAAKLQTRRVEANATQSSRDGVAQLSVSSSLERQPLRQLSQRRRLVRARHGHVFATWHRVISRVAARLCAAPWTGSSRSTSTARCRATSPRRRSPAAPSHSSARS